MDPNDSQWELCKENVQPIRQGRNVSHLMEALTPLNDDKKKQIQQTKEYFEREIRMQDDSDDPLEVWCRYIEWTQQVNPNGGKEIIHLLECCIKKFGRDPRYQQDHRFLKVWLKLCDRRNSPLDYFDFLFNRCMFDQLATFYEAWAIFLENAGKFAKCEEVYKVGINRKVVPLKRLENHYREFLLRKESESNGMDECDGGPPMADQRLHLGALPATTKGVVKTDRSRSSRGAPLSSIQSNKPSANSKQKTGGFQIYDSTNNTVGSLPGKYNQWPKVPERNDHKENCSKPQKWTSSKVTTKASTSGNRPSVFIHADDDISNPEQGKSSATIFKDKLVLKEHKPGIDLSNDIGMPIPSMASADSKTWYAYDREALFMGNEEFTFEELRAMHVMKKQQSEKENSQSNIENDQLKNDAELARHCLHRPENDCAQGSTVAVDNAINNCNTHTSSDTAQSDSIKYCWNDDLLVVGDEELSFEEARANGIQQQQQQPQNKQSLNENKELDDLLTQESSKPKACQQLSFVSQPSTAQPNQNTCSASLFHDQEMTFKESQQLQNNAANNKTSQKVATNECLTQHLPTGFSIYQEENENDKKNPAFVLPADRNEQFAFNKAIAEKDHSSQKSRGFAIFQEDDERNTKSEKLSSFANVKQSKTNDFDFHNDNDDDNQEFKFNETLSMKDCAVNDLPGGFTIFQEDDNKNKNKSSDFSKGFPTTFAKLEVNANEDDKFMFDESFPQKDNMPSGFSIFQQDDTKDKHDNFAFSQDFPMSGKLTADDSFPQKEHVPSGFSIFQEEDTRDKHHQKSAFSKGFPMSGKVKADTNDDKFDDSFPQKEHVPSGFSIFQEDDVPRKSAFSSRMPSSSNNYSMKDKQTQPFLIDEDKQKNSMFDTSMPSPKALQVKPKGFSIWQEGDLNFDSQTNENKFSPSINQIESEDTVYLEPIKDNRVTNTNELLSVDPSFGFAKPIPIKDSNNYKQSLGFNICQEGDINSVKKKNLSTENNKQNRSSLTDSPSNLSLETLILPPKTAVKPLVIRPGQKQPAFSGFQDMKSYGAGFKKSPNCSMAAFSFCASSPTIHTKEAEMEVAEIFNQPSRWSDPLAHYKLPKLKEATGFEQFQLNSKGDNQQETFGIWEKPKSKATAMQFPIAFDEDIEMTNDKKNSNCKSIGLMSGKTQQTVAPVPVYKDSSTTQPDSHRPEQQFQSQFTTTAHEDNDNDYDMLSTTSATQYFTSQQPNKLVASTPFSKGILKPCKDFDEITSIFKVPSDQEKELRLSDIIEQHESISSAHSNTASSKSSGSRSSVECMSTITANSAVNITKRHHSSSSKDVFDHQKINPVYQEDFHMHEDKQPSDNFCVSDAQTPVDPIHPTMQQASKGEINIPLAARGHVINPFDRNVITAWVEQSNDYIRSQDGFWNGCGCPTPSVRPDTNVEIGNIIYSIDRQIGSGGFSEVFKASNCSDHNSSERLIDCRICVVKVVKSALISQWEFNISCKLHKRIKEEMFPEDMHESFINISRLFLYDNIGYLITTYYDRDTLLDLVNMYQKANRKLCVESVVHYAIEMLRIVECLHSCGLIHADIKPDNFLIRDGINGMSAADPLSIHSLVLIDLGRCIDMRSMPRDTAFKGSNNTDSFECDQMVKNEPWAYQSDYFSLGATIHLLITSKYMKPLTSHRNSRRVLLPGEFRKLFEHLFEKLFNINTLENPELLKSLRKDLEMYLEGENAKEKLIFQLEERDRLLLEFC